MPFKQIFVVILMLILVGVGAVAFAQRFLRETVVVGSQAPQSARIPVTQVDHSKWDALLKKYVDERGLVDYASWKSSETDRQALLDYLAMLSRAEVPLPEPLPPLTEIPPKPNKELQSATFAYWINAYNALTIEGILRAYPTDSIRNFTPEYWGYNIWHDLLLPVGDEQVSLDQIEHERLRPMGDFRIHFAIVCASRGCPRLRNEAYLPERVDEQLTEQAKQFMNDPRNFRYSVEGESTFIAWSPLLAWYGKDLGPDRATRMHRLSKWIDDERTRRIAVNPDTFVRRNEYDWGLNDQATADSTPQGAAPAATATASESVSEPAAHVDDSAQEAPETKAKSESPATIPGEAPRE